MNGVRPGTVVGAWAAATVLLVVVGAPPWLTVLPGVALLGVLPGAPDRRRRLVLAGVLGLVTVLALGLAAQVAHRVRGGSDVDRVVLAVLVVAALVTVVRAVPGGRSPG